MTTTQHQINAMRSLCAHLESDERIKCAHINDWGRFGNFEIFVTPAVHDRSATQRIRAVIKRNLPKGTRLRQMFAPDPIREYNRWTGKYKVRGHHRSFWSVDIDFEQYFEGINRFSSQIA